MKSLTFASVTLVAVLLGAAGTAQAQHYEPRSSSHNTHQSSYNNSRHGPQRDYHYQAPVYRPSHGHFEHHAPVYSPPIHIHRPQYPVYQSPPVCAPVSRYPTHGHRSSRW